MSTIREEVLGMLQEAKDLLGDEAMFAQERVALSLVENLVNDEEMTDDDDLIGIRDEIRNQLRIIKPLIEIHRAEMPDDKGYTKVAIEFADGTGASHTEVDYRYEDGMYIVTDTALGREYIYTQAHVKRVRLDD